MSGEHGSVLVRFGLDLSRPYVSLSSCARGPWAEPAWAPSMSLFHRLLLGRSAAGSWVPEPKPRFRREWGEGSSIRFRRSSKVHAHLNVQGDREKQWPCLVRGEKNFFFFDH